MKEDKYMEIAISLAKKGFGKTSPNPPVGCIIIKGNKIIAKGYHKKYGAAHAEVNALKNAGKKANGATMYVTLEPCAHIGKTPPCVDKIIESKIKKVIIGTKDYNPKTNGKSIRKLKKNKIEVKISNLDSVQELNEIHNKFIVKKTPFVTLKMATSLDGKITDPNQRWISGKKALEKVHELRKENDAILVGINTIINDDPRLTCRIKKGVNPIRIILDSNLKIPLNSCVLKQEGKTIIATTKKANKKKKKEIENKGIETIIIPEKKGKINLKKLVKELGKRNITSLLVEGGSKTATSFLQEKLVDKLILLVSPKFIGEIGLNALFPKGNILEKFRNLKKISYTKIGKDVMLKGYF